MRLVLPARPDHDRLLDAEYDGVLPIRATAEAQGKVGDMIGTFWAGLYVIDGRFKDLLERNAITGWRLYEAVCQGLPSPAAWWVLGITGRTGRVRTGSETPLDPLGQFLDPREWDESDLFHPTNEGTTLVTRRAAQIIEEAGLRNVLLEPAGFSPTPE